MPCITFFVGPYLFTVLFSYKTGHHSYFTKERMEITLIIILLAMKMIRTRPLSILSVVSLLDSSYFSLQPVYPPTGKLPKQNFRIIIIDITNVKIKDEREVEDLMYMH